MFKVVMPDGTVRLCATKAEAYILIRDMQEAYSGYFK